MSKIIGNTVGTTMNPKKIAPNLGLLLIQETENGDVILTTKDNKPLILSPYELNISPYYLSFKNSNPLQGFKVVAPTERDDAVNKRYVDELVGDVEEALDNILALENALIGGDA